MINVILTGFMGTGKTTVAKILKEKLNMRYVDTDDIIQERAGIKIADIFENMGETHFRKLERDAIRQVTMSGDQVIATGGGAIVDEGNLKALKASGKVICLRARTDTIIDRVCKDDDRPLLQGKDIREKIEKLMQKREEYYNEADYIIDTDEKAPEEIADSIIRYLKADYDTVKVKLGERSYNILIGARILKKVGNELRSLGYTDKAVVVTNSTVNEIYGYRLLKSLKRAGIKAELIVVDDTEKSKSLKVVNDILTKLLELKCERNTPLIALGGGVVGDLTGFVASIYLRGVPFIQLPTTLLAQVDSSVGGKTGVNHKLGKNLIGSFYQPKLVMIDTAVLKTLPDEELLNGICEIIKYGVIKDADLFDYLKDNSAKLLKRDVNSLRHVIKRSCEIKAEIVSADEREAGLRAILNFGHTLGHALEATSKYKGIKHGRAVATGMIYAANLSFALGACKKALVDDIKGIIDKYGIDTQIRITVAGDIIETMKLDKKVKKGEIKFVLPVKKGEVKYGVSVNEGIIVKALDT